MDEKRYFLHSEILCVLILVPQRVDSQLLAQMLLNIVSQNGIIITKSEIRLMNNDCDAPLI